MARVKKAVGDLRARIANCSVRAAFALYAAIAIIAAIALTAIFSVVASLVAESTVEEDSDAYSGTFVFDEASNSLVPAETLSWYEAPRLRVPLRARRDGGPGGRERRDRRRHPLRRRKLPRRLKAGPRRRAPRLVGGGGPQALGPHPLDEPDLLVLRVGHRELPSGHRDVQVSSAVPRCPIRFDRRGF